MKYKIFEIADNQFKVEGYYTHQILIEPDFTKNEYPSVDAALARIETKEYPIREGAEYVILPFVRVPYKWE